MSTGRRFVIRPEDRRQDWRVAKHCAATIREAIADLHAKGLAVEVRIDRFKEKRRVSQNNCIWGWCTTISNWWADASGQSLLPEAWKLHFQKEFLGYVSTELPDGSIENVIRGTSSLSVQECADFLSRIDAWAADKDSLFLPRGIDYRIAMGVE